MPPAADDRAFLDLHTHSSYSFDSLARPEDMVRVAVRRGLTHLAITDHDRLEGAFRARDAAGEELTVIVGEEIRTRQGDLIGLYLERVVPPGLDLSEAIAAVHEQGGLAGLPHPFDRIRGVGKAAGREALLARLVDQLDFVEAWNARVLGGSANARAAEFAHHHGLPGVASSDSHSLLEVGVACTIVGGPVRTPGELRTALTHATLMTGRATYFVRGWTPLVKIINRVRGNGRVRPTVSIR